MKSTNKCLSLVFGLLFTHLIQPVDGYASWLKCFIELEEEEIVMHHPMIPAEHAREEVLIEVQPYGGDGEWFAAPEYTLGRGEKVSRNRDDLTTTTALKVRLKVPPSLQREDVQYVVEAKGDDVAFIDLGVMCDGVRAFSTKHDEHVVLQINTTATTTIENGNIELLAGWASGFEAVTLTRTMMLKRNPFVTVGSTTEEEL
jgi:hypothetical protein